MMTTAIMTPAISQEALLARYHLLCRACHTEVDDSPVQHTLANELKQLQTILLQDLPALARRGSPDHFADLWENLKQELERFHEFCEFPDLAQKVVVGLGGAFSAGKSSFINALLGQKRLVTEVDETTSLPTYLLHGPEERITALNLFKRRVQLSQAEFLSLTHDEKLKYGSQVSALLYSAFVSVPEFTFRNLALLDTPGYSKPDDPHWHERTDAQLARSQLNSAQFLIWLISAEAGTISEADLKFLASLRPGIPRLIIISRADKRVPEDIARMVALVRSTLANRALTAVDVIPFSTRKQQDFPLDPILQSLNTWNAAPREPGFALNFKRQFSAYQRFLDDEQHLARWRLNRLNRILALTDDEEVLADAQDLRDLAERELRKLHQISEDLQCLRQRFFQGLKTIGDEVGIPLPEPKDIDLMETHEVDLLVLLRKLK